MIGYRRFHYDSGWPWLGAVTYTNAHDRGAPAVGDRVFAFNDYPWPEVKTIVGVDKRGHFIVDGWRYTAWAVARLRGVAVVRDPDPREPRRRRLPLGQVRRTRN